MSDKNGFELLYIKIWIKDLLASTHDMSEGEFGVYMRLLFHQGMHGDLPVDKSRLARISGVSAYKFTNLWKIIGAKFERINEKYLNPRMAEERAKAYNLHLLAVDKGRAGGLATAKAPATAPRVAIHKPLIKEPDKTPLVAPPEPVKGLPQIYSHYINLYNKATSSMVATSVAPRNVGAEIKRLLAAYSIEQVNAMTDNYFTWCKRDRETPLGVGKFFAYSKSEEFISVPRGKKTMAEQVKELRERDKL